VDSSACPRKELARNKINRKTVLIRIG